MICFRQNSILEQNFKTGAHMHPTKIGIALVFSLSFILTSCWPTDSGSNNCSFAETDNEWVYTTSSHYEDGTSESDVKVTVTDTGAIAHYKSKRSGSMSFEMRCYNSYPGSQNTLPDEEHPQTETWQNFVTTYYCKNGIYYGESDEFINFKDENSQYKSRKQLFDKHMESCKAAGKYYGAGPFF